VIFWLTDRAAGAIVPVDLRQAGPRTPLPPRCRIRAPPDMRTLPAWTDEWIWRVSKNSIKRQVALVHRLLPQAREAPSFLIAGAQKAGTTALFNYLGRHGSFRRPLLKDVHFFDLNHTRGLEWYLSHFPSKAAMARLRRRTGANTATGEGATYYLFHPWVPARIAEAFPEIKVIILLRDPVKRAVSHYHHNVRMGRERLPMREAFEREPDRIGTESARLEVDPAFQSFNHQHFSYLARGAYAEQLRRWHRHFPSEQMLILSSEDLNASTDEIFQQVCRFIGIPAHSLPSYPREGAAPRAGRDLDAEAFARTRFKSANEELFDLLGRRFDWQ
jgi:Sulfotransferase domain